MLVEEQRTNLVKYSNGSGGSSSATYGGVTATKVRQETRNGVTGSVITISGTASITSGFALSLVTSSDIVTTTGRTFTFSAYTEVIENRGGILPVVQLGVKTLNGGTQIDFDRVFLNLQTISGFGRRSGTCTTDQASMTAIQPNIEVAFSSGNSYDFDIWVGGIQTEEASFASSLIPTTSSAATRSADVIINSASNTIPFSSWYNQVEGCLFTEAKAAYNTATTARRIAEISDGSLNNRWFHNIEGSTGNNVSIYVNSGGVIQFSDISALTSDEFRKFASSVKTDGAYAIVLS